MNVEQPPRWLECGAHGAMEGTGTTVPRTHHNVPHSCLAFSRDRSPPGISVSSAETRNGISRRRRSPRKFNLIHQPALLQRDLIARFACNEPDSIGNESFFLSFASCWNQLIERTADTGGSVKGSCDGFEENLERVGMKTSAWRDMEELIRGADVLFGESV